jgi:hypothetical protein
VLSHDNVNNFNSCLLFLRFRDFTKQENEKSVWDRCFFDCLPSFSFLDGSFFYRVRFLSGFSGGIKSFKYAKALNFLFRTRATKAIAYALRLGASQVFFGHTGSSWVVA